MKIWLYENRDVKTKDLIKALNRKLLGHYHYYGVSNNGRMMYNFRQRTIEILFKVLNKRSNEEVTTGMDLTRCSKYIKYKCQRYM